MNLSVGEVDAAAWDWLLFNDESCAMLNMEFLAEGAVHLGVSCGPERGPKGAPCSDGWSMLLFPAVGLEGGVLGYCYGGIPGCHGDYLLGLGELLDERFYVKYVGDRPRTLLSARFESGYIAVLDSYLEDLCNNGSMDVKVVHRDQAYNVVRPMRLTEQWVCQECLLLTCACDTPSAPQTVVRPVWPSAAVTSESSVLGRWRKYLYFVSSLARLKATLCVSVTTTFEASLLGVDVGMTNVATVKPDLLPFGARVEARKMEFMSRLLRQWSPRRGPAADSLDMTATVVTDGSSMPDLTDEGGWDDGWYQHELESGSRVQPQGSGRRKAPSTAAHVCATCQASFARKYELNRHKKLVHEAVRENLCDRCGKGFAYPQQLREHVLAVHEGRREYVCPHCGMGFATVAKRRRHERCVHLNERPFECEVCGYQCFQQSDLMRHQRRKHKTHGTEQCLSGTTLDVAAPDVRSPVN